MRPAYNLFAFAAGAVIRVTHRYRHPDSLTLAFLQNCRVPVMEDARDIENRLALLKPLGIDPHSVSSDLFVVLTQESETFSEEYPSERGLGESTGLICVHAGSGPVENEKKRWGVDNFGREIEKLGRETGAQCALLFGNRDEMALNRRLANRLETIDAYIPLTTFKQTASLVARCDYFLSNDSSLVHVGACFEIPQKAFFVASNPSRIRPWNRNAETVVASGCAEYTYPFGRIRPG